MIKENKAAYLLGLHGPDLLFYYHSYSKNRINQLGVKMHEETARSFLKSEKTVSKETKLRIVVLSLRFHVPLHAGQRMPSLYQPLYG